MSVRKTCGVFSWKGDQFQAKTEIEVAGVSGS